MGSMHSGMDLSQFKKVKSDKKTTTLRHAKGHEIKIAHSGLTPKLKGMLDGLQMFADNKDGVQDPAAMDDSSPATASDTPAAPEFEGNVTPATSQEFQNDSTTGTASAPDQSQSTQEQDHLASQTAPGNDVMSSSKSPPPGKPLDWLSTPTPDVSVSGPKATTPADVQQENNNQKYDINQGHIDPKDLGDLFADRQTPGKIGMLIGMMMSGAGSGLAHQPDKYMGLINDQLNRDFEAQKQSAANQQNFLKLGQENELRKANTAHTNADTLILGQMYGKQLLNNLTEYHVNRMSGLLPPSSAAQVAPILGLSQQNFQNQNDQATTEGLGKVGLNHLKDPPKADPNSGVDLNKITHLQNAANYAALYPKIALQEGVPSQDDMRHINDQAAQMSTNRYITGLYHNNYNNLDTTFAGQGGEGTDSGLSVLGGLAKKISVLLPPGTPSAKIAEALGNTPDGALFSRFDQYRKSQMADVVARLTNAATGGHATLEQAHDIAEGLFPNIWDLNSPETRGAKLKSGDDALEANESGLTYLQRFGVGTKFPRATYNQRQSQTMPDSDSTQKKGWGPSESSIPSPGDAASSVVNFLNTPVDVAGALTGANKLTKKNK